jgi:hypothetical protein
MRRGRPRREESKTRFQGLLRELCTHDDALCLMQGDALSVPSQLPREPDRRHRRRRSKARSICNGDKT